MYDIEKYDLRESPSARFLSQEIRSLFFEILWQLVI